LEQNKDNNKTMIDWWIGTVTLAFFPIIVSVIISIIRYTEVDFVRMIGDGELILSAFTICAPTLIGHFNEKIKVNKILFYLLLISSFLQLVTYTSIKTNSDNTFIIVVIASILCVGSSVIISWKSEVFFREANNGGI